MKKIILILFTVTSFISMSVYVGAEEGIAGKIKIPLSFPQKYNTRMKSTPVLKKPVKISGKMLLGISMQPMVDDVESDKYLVEYFLDDELIFSTNGENSGQPDSPTFDFVLDSAKYKNGSHKLVVNFWNKDGPSAIGMQKVIIENLSQGD